MEQPCAIVSGSAAWLLSRLLRSPDNRRVLDNPPTWIERDDVADTVTAIHLAARAFAAPTALERGKAATVGATVAQSASNWTTQQTASYLRISVRRTQELAPDLGGVRVGRQWLIPATVVRLYAEQRDAAA